MTSKKENENRFRAKVFKALSDPTRLKILDFLRNGEKCVCEIIPHVGLIQPVVSRHLKILKDTGLVRDKKDGNRRLYSITEPKVSEIIDGITPELISKYTEQILKRAV
ncbi:MAG TPA: metalloregulator ArsR/SmtB family transcription factor [Candidatus Deferrimicrobiaceae bacterium]|nr:metalloregulator ArsR/SmtB family transcription factor [Candidatus Deferrimicrobiaceae bacterium]